MMSIFASIYDIMDMEREKFINCKKLQDIYRIKYKGYERLCILQK